MSLVSVIIPVYNRQDYIEECIRSVLSQSHRDFEIIVVDDGSTDDTQQICRRLADQDARIRLLSGGHKGVSAARNIALDAAAGTYFFFLDSDDVIHPFLLETLVSAMEESGAAMGGTETIHISQNNWQAAQKALQAQSGVGETTLKTHEEALEALFFGPSPLTFLIGLMMHRDLVGATRFRTDLFIGEDYYFVYEALIKGSGCVFLKQKWYYQRLHDSNSSWNYSYSAFWSRFYRRELVWKSEEAFGRTNYAVTQKRDAFACFTNCVRKHKPYSEESKQMRQVLKRYKKDLFPALTGKNKPLYLLFLYLPATASLLLRLKDRLK